jgi:hypothetical protein
LVSEIWQSGASEPDDPVSYQIDAFRHATAQINEQRPVNIPVRASNGPLVDFIPQVEIEETRQIGGKGLE